MQWLRDALSLDVRSLVLLRVCIGLIVFIDVVRRSDTLDFYTDEGSYIQQPGDTQHRCLFHEIWFWKGTWHVQALLFALTGGAALCLSVGLCTPLANTVAWIGIVAIHGRNECVNDSSDKMLRNILFWCLVMPLGAVGSVDRARRLRLRASGTSPPPAGWPCATGWQHLSPGTAGLLLQIVCLYLAVCWQRRNSREWFGSFALAPFAGSSDPDVDFSAVYSMLGSPFAAKGFGKLLASSCPSLMWILAVAGDAAELLAPLLLITSTVASWRRMLPVCENRLFVPLFMLTPPRSFRQDRLETNIEKLKKGTFCSGCRPPRAAGGHQLRALPNGLWPHRWLHNGGVCSNTRMGVVVAARQWRHHCRCRGGWRAPTSAAVACRRQGDDPPACRSRRRRRRCRPGRDKEKDRRRSASRIRSGRGRSGGGVAPSNCAGFGAAYIRRDDDDDDDDDDER